jgi:hypothetical protein
MNRIVNEVHGYVLSRYQFRMHPLTLAIACAASCTTSPRSRPERSRWSKSSIIRESCDPYWIVFEA